MSGRLATLAAPLSPEAPAARARAGRQQILAAIREAAIVEFGRHGYEGASTQAIAERAGLSKPHLHYYISGKQQLYDELLHDLLAGWSRAFAFDTSSNDPRAVLSGYVRHKLAYAFENPALSRIFTNELLAGGQRLGNYWPGALQSIQRKVDTIDRWIAEGRIRRLDSRVLLMQIWGMTQHYADYAVQVQQVLGAEAGSADGRERIARELTNFVLLGCGLAPD